MADLLIRKWRHLVVLLLVILVPAGVLWARYEWNCRKKQRVYKARLQDLRQRTQALPLGSSKEATEQFFNDNQWAFQRMTDEGKNALVAQETVKSCGAWYCDDEVVLRVTVRFGDDGRVVSRDVHAWRTCM